jgi:replication-associated recombination protein RarA
MSLFDDQLPPAEAYEGISGEGAGEGTPLAERMRPAGLSEVVGQEAVVGEGAFLRRAIDAGRVPSLIFWGPPGTGKTTLAHIIAARTELRFVPFSAVTSGVKGVKEVMAGAARIRKATGQRSLLFVDEIHRFNRAQQDAFLPYVERGDIVLVGATTENPSFELNGALLSRCRVVVLEGLSTEGLTDLLERALADPERGLGEMGVEADREALESIAQLASGDARRALNLLELAAADALADDGESEPGRLTVETVRRVERKKTLLYDKSGEEHFNLISALHKSLRESDADAALYWLARMLAAGEDPLTSRFGKRLRKLHGDARRRLRVVAEGFGKAVELVARRFVSVDELQDHPITARDARAKAPRHQRLPCPRFEPVHANLAVARRVEFQVFTGCQLLRRGFDAAGE